MLRLSKLTDYGTVVLAEMAQDPNTVFTASDLAARTHLTLPTVSKLLKLFAKGQLVRSFRGAHGGYKLARNPEAITAVDIIDAVEGPVAITECSAADGKCNLESVCAIGHNWQRISVRIRAALAAVTLAELASPKPDHNPQFKLKTPQQATV